MCAARRSAIGFDFGTSTTLVASARKVVPIGLGAVRESMPSLVGYADDGTLQVAEKAEALVAEQCIRSIKRAITENLEAVEVPVPPYSASADDLIVELLREAARRAARQGQDFSGATPLRLGCPAMWDGKQRRRLLRAAQRASVPALLATMVDEPVAAGIAWLADQSIEFHRPLRIVVFDMGGGTLDVAVLEAWHKEISVLAALGTADAGDALDKAIAADLESELNALGIYPKHLRRTRHWLQDQARITKEALSREHEHVIVLSTDFIGQTGEIWYTRDRLNEAFRPQMDRAEEAVDLALRIARLSGSADPDEVALVSAQSLARDVDVVLLSGGMCRIPYVAERLREMFGPDAAIEFATNPPEQAVVVGLAKAANYDKVNIFRPAFDIVLEWDSGREYRTIYEAFTPIAGNAKIAGQGNKFRVRRASSLSLPPEGKGRIRVISQSGERVRATLGGRAMDGYPVSFTDVVFTFSIFPDGRVQLIDTNGVADGFIEWHKHEAARPLHPADVRSLASAVPSPSPPRDESVVAEPGDMSEWADDDVDDLTWADVDDARRRQERFIEDIAREDVYPALGGHSFGILQEELQKVLQTLSEREADLVRLRLGLFDGKPRSRSEIAKMYGVTPERIRQIERDALAKLRHPSRSQTLRDFLE